MEHTFGKKVKELRRSMKLTQEQLAGMVGVSKRTIQNYEADSNAPRGLSDWQRLADALGTTSAYLMGHAGKKASGTSSDPSSPQRDIAELREQVTALFAGGELPEEDKDALMEAFTRAYFLSKQKKAK